MKKLLEKLSQYQFNGQASLLLIILSANFLITLFVVGFIASVFQAIISCTIAILGGKAQIEKRI
jgi:hypothetical protein